MGARGVEGLGTHVGGRLIAFPVLYLTLLHICQSQNSNNTTPTLQHTNLFMYHVLTFNVLSCTSTCILN